MKYKIPNKEFIKISLDRLTRFKSVSQRYKRVFDDILSKHLIFEGIKISQMNEDEKIELASMIFNSALNEKSDLSINKIIIEDEKKIYHLNESDIKYLNSKIDFGAALNMFLEDELPLNLKRLKLQKNKNSEDTRKEFSTLYPVSKVVLVEGITEEILLIEFAKFLDCDFKKEGIYVLGAGGKNQVAKKYYKLIEEIKIPVFILLDCDASETYDLIFPKLRKTDEIYKIKSGEFEDILSKNLIKNALNYHFQENLQTQDNNIQEGHTVDCLSEYYKNNGWGEFKKADFAKIIREYLQKTKNPPISEELSLIINKIKLI